MILLIIIVIFFYNDQYKFIFVKLFENVIGCLKVMNRYGLNFMKMITKKLEHGCLGMGTSNEHGYE